MYVARFEMKFCIIFVGNSTLLEGYTRIPNLYNTRVPIGPDGYLEWDYDYFDDHIPNLEEECARLCEEESNYICRQFHVSAQGKYCEWLEYGQFYGGGEVSYRYDTDGDTYIKKSTCKYKIETS